MPKMPVGYVPKTYTPIISDVTFLGMELKCFEHKSRYRIVGLPEESHVYFLVIKKRNSRHFTLAYIGLSTKMASRFRSHNKIARLRLNQKKGGYRIYVMFKSFGSLYDNKRAETELIWKYLPPMSREKKRLKIFFERDFWNEVGVKDVVVGKYYYFEQHSKDLRYY